MIDFREFTNFFDTIAFPRTHEPNEVTSLVRGAHQRAVEGRDAARSFMPGIRQVQGPQRARQRYTLASRRSTAWRKGFDHSGTPFARRRNLCGSATTNPTRSPGNRRRSEPKLPPSPPTSSAPRRMAYQLKREEMPLTTKEAITATRRCGVPRNQ